MTRPRRNTSWPWPAATSPASASSPCDLLDAAAMLAAARGCSSIFHVALPCTVDRVFGPLVLLPLDRPAAFPSELRPLSTVWRLSCFVVAEGAGGAGHGGDAQSDAHHQGCRGVRRVVVTLSVCSIVPSPGWPAGEVLDERCWTDNDYCDKNVVWHPASKILAEKASWKFVEENGLDVVVVNPWTVLDPIIPPRINASMAMFLCLLEEEYKDFFIGSVHVEDVALTHIMLFENPAAFGRHLCVEPICHWGDFASKVAELYPDYKVPKFPEDTQPGLVRAEAVLKKLVALGLQFTPLEKIIRDTVESHRRRGCIA